MTDRLKGWTWRAWKRVYCGTLKHTDRFHRWLHRWAGRPA